MQLIVKNLKPNEKIIVIIRRYWISFFKDILVCFILIPIPLFLLYFILNENNNTFKIIYLSLFFCAIFFGLIWLIRTLVIWYFDALVITNFRIFDITQTGMFYRKISEINLKEIQGISHDISGIFETFLKYGELKIETNNPNTNLLIADIKNPFDIQQLINDRKSKLLEQESKEEKLTQEEILLLVNRLKNNLSKEDLYKLFFD